MAASTARHEVLTSSVHPKRLRRFFLFNVPEHGKKLTAPSLLLWTSSVVLHAKHIHPYVWYVVVGTKTIAHLANDV